MRALSEADFLREAKPSFDRVFAAAAPFGEPFAPVMEARAILFPVHYQMGRALARAIRKGSTRLHESSFYFSVLERPQAEEQDRPYHWHIPFDQLREYDALGYPFVVENAIYSTSGTWGLIFSHEHHAIIGGPAAFVEGVTKSGDKQAERFVKAWKENQDRFGSKLDWLPRLLVHVYGDERTGKLLAEAGLERSSRCTAAPVTEAAFVERAVTKT
jgi:hypothetical protein